ncbi:hypothetical protein GPJ56_009055 [Histomonas meleagridis]|uniref:uncharacterized protein n=1 Tax=Histomonas meleagridis TaxID=135588 RepID=UPI003559CCF7|nr:hypothetical protein GPJ56_009055 [Histomonas meleagridis]KAH0799289.1 hypothetical protein GO595_008086 [Histomonas meleagridis]
MNIVGRNYSAIPFISQIFPRAQLDQMYEDSSEETRSAVLYDFQSPPNNAVVTKATFLNIISMRIPEFINTQKIPRERALPRYTIRKPLNPPKSFTKSYIYRESELQSNVFDSSILNSEYVSLYVGSESGNENNRDEKLVGLIEQYFLDTSKVPTYHVEMENLKLAYSLLSTHQYFEYNRFPFYLRRSVKMIFDKRANKLLKEMKKNYENCAPIVADYFYNTLMKFVVAMPKYMEFFAGRNSVNAAYKHYKFADNAKDKTLSMYKNESFEISIEPTCNYTLKFLKAYIEKVYRNDFSILFNLIESPKREFYTIRIFGAAIAYIPEINKLFEKFDEEMENEMHDMLSLIGKDNILLEISEKLCERGDSEYCNFMTSGAPLSMKLFLKFAVSFNNSYKFEMNAEKFPCTTRTGMKLMETVNEFSRIVILFLNNHETLALYALYSTNAFMRKKKYLLEAKQILNGRDVLSVEKDENIFRMKIIKNELNLFNNSFNLFLGATPTQ